MQYNTAFSNWLIDTANDTITDLTNGLTWCRKYLCVEGIGIGDSFTGEWLQMSELLGRGVQAFERTTSNARADIVIQTFPKTQFEMGYTSGTRNVSHAGFTDWRLPTLQEVVTITFEEAWGAKRISKGIDDPEEITKTLFDDSCRYKSFWTANMCGQEKEFRMLFGLKPALPPIAWCFIIDDKVRPYELGGQIEPHLCGALLVRNS